MSFKRISLLVLLFLVVATAVKLLGGKSSAPPEAPPASEIPSAPPAATLQPVPPPQAAQKPAPAVPSTPALSQAAQNPPPPVMQSAEEEERSEKEEMDAALAQLRSPDPQRRVEGAELLGAYPTQEVELALTQALSDTDAEVRNAVAQSLGYVEAPKEETISALMTMLEDQNEEVRASALSSLEDYLAGSDEGTKRYKRIFSELKSKGAARSIPQDVREGIREIIQDQQQD